MHKPRHVPLLAAAAIAVCAAWISAAPARVSPVPAQTRTSASACAATGGDQVTVTTTGATYVATTPSTTPSNFFVSGQNADVLISGIGFDNSGGAQLFNHPGGIATDGTKLVVADTFNNRILIWNSAPSSNVAADVVVGQPDMTSNDPGTGLNQLNWPISVAVAGGKLFVADTYNHRVLIWNTIPQTSGAAADVEISRTVLGSLEPWIWGVWSNGTKMVVTATSASKVFVWNTVPTTNNQAPSFELLGYPSGETTSDFGTPRHVSSNGTMLLIGDHNAKVPDMAEAGTFVWNTFPTSGDTPYSYYRQDPVEPNNGPWMKGTFFADGSLWAFGRSVYQWANPSTSEGISPMPSVTLTNYEFNGGDYGGVVQANGRMYVATGNGNKVLGFTTPPSSNTAEPDFVIGASDVCANSLNDNFFIQNGLPRSNGTSLFVASDFDRKLYVWRNLPDQSNPHPDLYFNLPFQPWGIALHGSRLAIAGSRNVYVWNSLPTDGASPSLTFQDMIGTGGSGAALQRVRGVAMDDTYFYVSDDQADKIYVWAGVPASSTTNPAFSISVTDPQRLSSDGTYLAVTDTNQHRILIYSVATLSASASPVAIVAGGIGQNIFNLPQDAHIGQGRLFVADTGFSRVKIWSSLADVVDGTVPEADVFLGATNDNDRTPEIGRDKAFWPGAVHFDGRFLWVGEFKFSTRLLRYSPPCSYHVLSATSQSVAATAVNGSVTVTPYDSTCAWTASSSESWLSITSGASGTGTGTIAYTAAANTGGARSATITVGNQTITVSQAAAQLPTMALDRTALAFAATNNGSALTAATSAQAVRMTQSGSGTVTWTATSDKPWLTVSPASGSGSGVLSIAVTYDSSLPVSGTATGAITITFTGADNAPGPVSVSLSLSSAGSVPFGIFDTPVDNSSGVAGSIAVTGWALDDIEVTSIALCRDTVSGEAVASDTRCNGLAQVFIGNAVFVEGARPDLVTLHPTLPRNTRGGWGYLLLTNFLPNQGNGTFELYAYATDADGHTVALGDGTVMSKTITCDNANAVKPFGAIDTPAQGATISGSGYLNFGWVLARGSRRADPPGGGTVSAVIDGAVVGAPGGWTNRSDITALFPVEQYAGVTQAAGVYTFDSTALANGVHTIAWVVTDNEGNADGIGSRYFTVTNGTSGPLMEAVRAEAALGAVPARPDYTAIQYRRGFDLATPLQWLEADAAGLFVAHGEELDRFELHLGNGLGGTIAGYLRANGRLFPLPAGSRLDSKSGLFTWMPGVAFVGPYEFVFLRTAGGTVFEQSVRIVLHPKGSGRVGTHLVIDTPSAGAHTNGPLTIAGWAVDLAASSGTGIDAVHAWAYPATGGAPIFLGAAALGGERPDIAVLFGERYRASGYDLTAAGLPPGDYLFAVFPHRTGAGPFGAARTVRVTVR